MYGASIADRVEVTDTGVKIYESSKQMVNVGASGLDVYDTSNNQVARFAATTYIGDQSSEHIKIQSNKFELKRGSEVFVSASSDGLYTSGSINASTGEIGGWTIGTSTLTGGVVTINSAGSIEVGSLANATTTATTNSGFFADSSGNVLIKGNVSGNDYLKISAAGGIDIKSQTFDLDATTIVLESSNNGKVRVGAASGQRVEIVGSSGELAFYNSDNDQRMRLLTRTEQTSYVDANGTATLSSEKAAIQDMTAGRLSINGAIQAQWDDTYTTSSLEGGKFYMTAKMDSSLNKGATNIRLAEFHVSASVYQSIGAAQVTAISASAVNATFGKAVGIDVGQVKSEWQPAGIQINGVHNTATYGAVGLRIPVGALMQGTSDMGGLLYGVHSAYPLASSGSSYWPTYTFTNDIQSGFFSPSARNIGVSCYSIEEFRFAEGGHFHADNDITAYSSTVASDIRLKENIKALENNLDKVLELKPSSFTWKIRDKQDDVGLIAQEVESIIPMIVQDTISIGGTKEFLDGDTHKVIDYAKLTTYLIGAIQEQQKQIDELKKKLEVT
jgi:hypothetical protein